MYSYPQVRKFVTLHNGKRLLLRLVNDQDGDFLARLVQELGGAGLPLRPGGQEILQVQKNLAASLNYLKLLPLAAVDFESHSFAACALLTRSGYPTPHLGEISLTVSPAFHHLGVGALMLDELIAWAAAEELALLRACVAAEEEDALRVFQEKGFQVQAGGRDFIPGREVTAPKVLVMLRFLGRKKTGGQTDSTDKLLHW